MALFNTLALEKGYHKKIPLSQEPVHGLSKWRQFLFFSELANFE
jgi:hypothetical protein